MLRFCWRLHYTSCRQQLVNIILPNNLNHLNSKWPKLSASPNKSATAKDDMGVFTTADCDENSEIHRICSSGTLTQYIYNLRAWIACTILQRVDAEIQKTNRAFALNTNADLRGFADIQIGKVGLDRLKKTSEVHQLVAIYVPTLPMLIPFLEMSTNQEYLVQRIKGKRLFNIE